LDSFGDVGAAAQELQVHPKTVRYRVRRVEQLKVVSLSDPEVRLLFLLGPRIVERSP
ncbi:helix-turn-helix domain-containing protein, partial [Mycobacterium sp. THU-M104]|uniref:helix-turn-helix domain-containing protein n=1 Tax=Mycobacterium sp. THU-M104 TaxID=3410515 RepID=UPI003B9B5F4D